MVANPPAVRQPQSADSAVKPFLTWLSTELAPFPGRGAATIRLMTACLVVVTISITLQVPLAYLSGFFVFWIAREDMVTTAITCIVLAVAVTLGIAFTLLVYQVTIDHPPLRVALMSVLFCAAMYGSRSLTVGPIAWGVGLVVIVTHAFVDMYPQPEVLVRATLWAWVAMTFPIVVLLIANRFILPARPNVLLRREAKRRLAFVSEALDRQLAGPGVEPSLRFDAKVVDATRLVGLLKLSASVAPALKERLPSYELIITALNRMVEAACMLNALRPAVDSPERRARIGELRAACDDLGRALDGDLGTFRGVSKPGPSDSGPIASILAEMERHMTEIADGLRGLSTPASAPAPAAAPSGSRHLFVSDAFSNPVYLQFAVKVTLAAMFCYVAYTLVDWPGIHTCLITCGVVGLTSTGATIHKASLRLTGALIGGGLAILATVFVVPHLESIGGLLLLIAPVAALAGWITSGSERSSYAGVQIAMAFFFCVLQGFEPNSDVTYARDRLVGIVFGISVLALIFTYVWPERVEPQMRAALAKALRTGAALLKRHGGSAMSATEPPIAAERTVLFEKLVLAQRLADVAQFEPELSSNAGHPGSEAEADLVAATQATAVSALKLAHLREANAAQPGGRAAHVLKAFDNAIAAVLRPIADRLEAGAPGDDLLARAAWRRFSRFEQAHMNRLTASGSGPDVVDAFDDLLARVKWLAGAQGRSTGTEVTG
jgi:multidrug resistance protein MdtO